LVRGAAARRTGENGKKINSYIFSILSAAAMKSAKNWEKKSFIFILIPTADIFRQEFS